MSEGAVIMHKYIMGIVLINIFSIGTPLASDISCPDTITMDQLSTLGDKGEITIKNVLFEAEDRENIQKIAPKSYHPSYWTGQAHLRKSATVDNQLLCYYGYKGVIGNVSSKVSSSVSNIPKEELNQQHDYTFTLIHQLPIDNHITTTTTEVTTETTIEKHAPTHDDEDKTPVTTTEITTETTSESSPIEAVVITKEEIAENKELSAYLATLGIGNSKVTEKIVDLQYQLILAQAESNPMDLVEINNAYEYVKQYFADKRKQL